MDILASYRKSMEEYQKDLEQKSKHWQEEYDVRTHLYNPENLINFRNNELSEGLDDQFSDEVQKDMYNSLIKELGPEYVHSKMSKKNIGNLRSPLKINELYTDGGQLTHIKWLHDLEEHVFSKKDVRYICEIGGGYGSFAEKIAKTVNCKYVLIDLPEANVLSTYFLSQHFPEKKFLLSADIESEEITAKDLDEYDFIIIPPWYKVTGIKFDLFINTRSMMEMNFNVIEKYFSFIQNNIADDGYFLNINRYLKATVGHLIRLWKYPYDDKWHVILSRPSWRQDYIHELITQRKTSRGNIKRELFFIGVKNKIQRRIKNLKRQFLK